MKFLVWDTSSRTGSVAAFESVDRGLAEGAAPSLAAELALDVEARHSERLLWGIDQVLKSAKWKLEDLDFLGVGVGPGSFTGLRIGLTTARTLGHILGKPVVGVSSLAALARPAALWLRELRPKAYLIAGVESSLGQVFVLRGPARAVAECVAMAQGDLPGIWKRGAREEKLAVSELGRVLGDVDGEWMAVGRAVEGLAELRKILPKSEEIQMPTPFADAIQPRFLGQLAWEAYQQGLARPALSVLPRYLRESAAEEKLKAGLLPVAVLEEPNEEPKKGVK